MAYYITEDCVFCRNGCAKHCPVNAISFDGDRNWIDPEKCIECGICARDCNREAIIKVGQIRAEPEPHEPITLECDVVVVGGGAAGLIAALKATEDSGKRVLVLEKDRRAGGCGFYASGFHVYDTAWQRAAGQSRYLRDDLVRAAFNTTRGEISEDFIENTYRAGTEFFDWFCQWGEPEQQFRLSRNYEDWDHLEDGVPLVSGSTCDQPMLTNLEPDSAGKYIMRRAVQRCGQLGVEIRTQTAAYQLILENGAVAGVLARDPGGEVCVKCSACLLATGNMAAATDLLERFMPFYAHADARRTAHAMPTCTGDSIRMAEQAGIPVDYDSIASGFIGSMVAPFHPELLTQNRRGEVLKVNAEGRRWINESVRGEGCNFALQHQPRCMTWIVMDAAILNMDPLPQLPIMYDSNAGRRMFTAIPDDQGRPNPYANMVRLGPAPPNFSAVGDGTRADKTSMFDQLAQLPGKHVVRGDTLEELADGIGVDRGVFLATVQRYNQLCALGRDTDHFKPASHMLPIEKGPFYALHNHLASDGVFGGLRVTKNTEVIGRDGIVLGLYAAGDNTSSRYINVGGEKREICSDLTWAFSSGYLAGEAISRYFNRI